jgi:opacity protein-like surface antigen
MKWLGAALLGLLITGIASPAFAQGTPKAEISGGYNWLAAKSSGDDTWEKFPKGWYFDVAGNVSDTVSIVGQVTGNYKHFDADDFDLKLHTFMVGIRGSSPGRVRGFGQVLIGGVNLKASDNTDSASETDLGFQLGGGVNVMGSGNVGLRVGVDYLRVMSKDAGQVLEGDDVNGFRFNVGVVIGIGSR